MARRCGEWYHSWTFQPYFCIIPYQIVQMANSTVRKTKSRQVALKVFKHHFSLFITDLFSTVKFSNLYCRLLVINHNQPFVTHKECLIFQFCNIISNIALMMSGWYSTSILFSAITAKSS